VVVEVLLSTLLKDAVGIVLSGLFLGFLAKIFRRSFTLGFLAGVLPKLLSPLVSPLLYFPYAFIALPLLLYFIFIWILLRFSVLKSLLFAILAYIVVLIGPIFLSNLLKL
jgi:ABC-type antimicrobial peptide transport system permease subunit